MIFKGRVVAIVLVLLAILCVYNLLWYIGYDNYHGEYQKDTNLNQGDYSNVGVYDKLLVDQDGILSNDKLLVDQDGILSNPYLPDASLVSSIDPDVGITVVLPQKNVAFRYALRQDIHNLAPTGFNKGPIFLSHDKAYLEMDRTELHKKEMRRFRDIYPVNTASNLPMVIQALVLVKTVAQRRNQVLMLAGNNVVDWGNLIEDVNAFKRGADGNEVVCLVDGEGEECNSYNMLYPMPVVDHILIVFQQNGPLSRDLDDIAHWQGYLRHIGVQIVEKSGSVSSAYVDGDTFFKDIMLRDPRFRDIIDMDDQEVQNNAKDVLLRLGNKVEYISGPDWTILPHNIDCTDDKGVYMVMSTHSAHERREYMREIFKSLNIKDYYFLLGRLPPDGVSLDEEVETHQDIVMYDEVDSYNMLTYKTFAAMAFVEEHCPKTNAMIKMDHDVFVRYDEFPMVNQNLSFHESGSLIDWEKIPDINCIFSMNQTGIQPVLRAKLPTGRYSWPNTVWPYSKHLVYCSGPVYSIKRGVIGTMLYHMKTFAWSVDPSVLFIGAKCNEDLIVTGRYRVLANAGLGHVAGANHYNKMDNEAYKGYFEKYIKVVKKPRGFWFAVASLFG